MKNKKGFTPLNSRKANLTGFTFIETLIVIGIIALLSTAVVVMVNPAKRFESARDRQREIHLQTILNAVYQRRTTEGEDCPGMPDEVDEETSTPVFQAIGSDHYDLYSCLVPFYLDNELFDPDGGSKEDTHYEIWRNPYTKRVTVRYVEKPQELFAGPKEYWIFGVPLVETGDIPEDKITHFTAEIIGSEVTSEEGSPVFERGVVCHTHSNPNYNNNLGRTIDGSGIGEFDSTIIDLTFNTTYYVRAYARNEIGVGYGSETKNFDTLSGAPAVRTEDAIHVTYNTAEIQGTILTVQSTPVTAYFCWNEGEESGAPFGQDPTECPNYTEVAIDITTAPYPFFYDLSELNEGWHYFKACGKVGEDARCGEIKNFETKLSAPHVVTLDPDDGYGEVLDKWAEVQGKIMSDGGYPITEKGICFVNVNEGNACDLDPDSDPSCKESEGELPGGIFYATIPDSVPGDPDLQPGNEYSICAYAKNNDNEWTSYGGEEKFEVEVIAPKLTTKPVVNESYSSAQSGGQVTSEGGAAVTQWGICWEEAPNTPEWTGVDPKTNPINCTEEPLGGDNFDSTISVYSDGLWGNTDYNVQAYAINSKGTGWANNSISFTTLSPVAPELSTETPDGVRAVEADVKGKITDHGGSPISALGVCFVASDEEPENLTHETADDCQRGARKNFGDFSLTIDGLSTDTTYWYQSFAKNEDVLEYGYAENLESFHTTLPLLPVVQTDGVVETGDDWVRIQGNVTDDGGDPETIKGICYNTEGYPSEEAGDPCEPYEYGIGKGEFVVKIESLDAGITYYAVAFAENSAGRVYDDIEGIEFITRLSDGSSCEHHYECMEESFCNRENICCSTQCDEDCWTCLEPNPGVCSFMPEGDDPHEDCTMTMECVDSCTAQGWPGYCGGDGYCEDYVDAQYAEYDGQVCYGDGEWKYAKDLTVADQFCGVYNDCTAGNCIGYKRYRGCKAGPYEDIPECTATNQLTETIKASSASESSGKVLNSSCQIVSGYCGVCCYCSNGSKTARSEDAYTSDCNECHACNGTEKTTCTKDVVKSTWGSGSYGCDNQSMCVNGQCLAGNRYYLYVTASDYDGNLGGRSGADAKCNLAATYSNKPDKCTRDGWAFITVSSTDEIYDFRFSSNQHSVNTSLPWWWKKRSNEAKYAAENFYDLFDTDDLYADASSAGFTANYWTGSGADGHRFWDDYYGEYSYCSGWLNNVTQHGRRGSRFSRNEAWLSAGRTSCRYDNSLLCACIGIE